VTTIAGTEIVSARSVDAVNIPRVVIVGLS
jgi:hypothetical protein